jgi:hypothetical protein
VLAPAAQLATSHGLVWQPLADVYNAHNPGDVRTKQALCRQIMKAAGEDMTNQGVQVASHRYCETVFFLRAALENATAVTPAGLLSAVTQLADGYPPATTFRTRFSSGRPDGPDRIRPFRFEQSCSCFVYAGAPRDLSAR